MQDLKATTVRNAKIQAKRLHPEGGTIYGYTMADKAPIYICQIYPQGGSPAGVRRAYSDRINIRGVKASFVQKPEYFEFQTARSGFNV